MENPEIRRHKIKKLKKKEKIDREKVASPNGESSPPKKKKIKKTGACEDIIDGFAIRSFKSYEDLLKIIDKEKERAALLQGSQNIADGGEARISGCSGNDSVNSEPHNKNNSKLSPSNKVPKWKKTISTTDQENNASIMRLDLSRCSAHSEDQTVEDVSSSSANSTPDAAGIARQSHSHSLCQQQQQQFSSPLDPSLNALKPHPQYPNKNSVGSSLVRKHKSDERKDPFSISKQECTGNVDTPIDTSHQFPSPQSFKVAAEKGGLQSTFTDSKSNQRHNGNLDSNSNPPSTSFATVNNSLPGATPSSSKVQDNHFISNHRHKSNTQSQKSVHSTASSTLTSVDNVYNNVANKGEVPEVPQAGVKLVSNGSISSSKRQFEDHSQSRGFYPAPPNPDFVPGAVNVSPLVSQSSSQTTFAPVPVRKHSPKSVCSSGTQATVPKEPIVAPVTNRQVGQGRIGSQTLFTPYATTAITRVNSPLASGTGDSPSASRACSGFHSSTVIQPENSNESLNSKGSAPHPPHHSHQPYSSHHRPSQNQHSISKINQQHNQSINNNHLKNNSHNNFGHFPIDNGSSKSDSKLTVDSGTQSSNKSQKHRNSDDHSNHSSTSTTLEHQNKKEHNSSEAIKNSVSGSRSHSFLPNNHHYSNHHQSQNHLVSQEKGPSSSTSVKSKASFGSITKLLDIPTSTSSSHSSPSPSAAKNSFANHPQSQANHYHQQHHPHHHPEHYQLHSSTNSHLFDIGGQGHPNARLEYSAHYVKNLETQAYGQVNKTTGEVPTSAGVGHSVSANNNINHRSSSSNNHTFSVAGAHSSSTSTHSPREPSPARERDSYSSNVSSLSRSSASVTPVSTFQQSASHYQQLSPNLSPHLQSSYSKAVSWLSSVPSYSPISRPTPPPPTSVPGYSGVTSVSLPSQPSTVPSPYRSYPGIPPSIELPSSHQVQASMFAPPLLPLSSIPVNPASQPPTYGPSTDSLYPVPTTSDILRRDFESRLTAADRGPSTFLSRPSDLHPHHSLLPPFSGVGHLSPHTPGAPPNPHSTMFSAPLFKDLSKVGMDSPFYRTNMVLSYPGINGILPPPGLATPFAPPPSQLPSYTQKKTGKWNAMHVRIAWEIYQQQQKGAGGDRSTSKAGPLPTNSLKPVSTLSSTSTSQTLPGLGRPADIPTPFAGQMMSHSAAARGMPYDPLLLNPATSHLGQSIPRYGFGALGPSFGGLSGLGSSLMGRDLSSLVSMSPGQDQWARFPSRPSFLDAGNTLGTNSQLCRPSEQRDSKTPTESRRQKDADIERPNRQSGSSREIHARVPSPFRDRSPIRTASKTPLESGEHDSRSSRSSDDSHNSSTIAVHSSHTKSSSSLRNNDDSTGSNGENEKALTPLLSSYDRQRISQGVDKSVLTPGLPSRMCPSSSPLATSSASAWDSFPAGLLGAGQPMGLNILQLSERERELSPRVPPPPSLASLRPNLFGPSPYGGLPLGALGVSQLSVSHSHSQGHLHSSQLHNGPNSPGAAASNKAQSQSEQIATASTAHSSRSKEDSHQLR